MADEILIRDLHVSVENREILKGVNLAIRKGEIAALMGPNGSGKSTLAYTIMGHPKYRVTSGEVIFKDKNILQMKPDERARMGIFLSFQYPHEISGVTLSNFLRTALNSVRNEKLSVRDFHAMLSEKMRMLGIDPSFAERYVNEGFSGGEKKRAEILQLAVLEPEIALLDETDSGLDIDALRTVANSVKKIYKEKGNMGIFIITHYQRILNYIEPDVVHVMIDGRIVSSGKGELAKELEEKGYAGFERM